MNLKFVLLCFLFCVLVLVQCKAKKLTGRKDSHYTINSPTIDSTIYRFILPYKNTVDSKMNLIIGKTEQALTKNQPESLLGNFVADCLFKQGKIYLEKDSLFLDMVLLNNGGLRSSLPKGEISLGKIFELMPFDNVLNLVELTGPKTFEMIQFIAEKGGIPVSGISINIKEGKPGDVKINGKHFDIHKNYFVLSSDYLIKGGDKMDFFKNPVKITSLNILIRDAIIDYCKRETAKGNFLNSQLDGRISITK
jgi:2',3'-cyclic-nucleotide 2'-phosphodiesterase (5'-nucleotidase family)